MATNYIPTVDEAEQIAKEVNRQIREVLGSRTSRATITPGVVRIVLSVASEVLSKTKEVVP